MVAKERAELDELLKEIPYDETDEEDGEKRPALQNLDATSMSLQVGGANGSGTDHYRQYSEINAREAEVRFDALIDFMKNYRPSSHRTRALIVGLVRLAIRFLNAPACRRQLRFEVAEARAKYWMNRLGKDGEEHIEQADRLLDLWGGADLRQIEVRDRRIRHGLDAVERERARWHTDTRKKEVAERLATRLPSAAYEYFRCRKQQYDINRERAEDEAQGVPVVDYSDVIKRIQSKDAPPAEIVTAMPWPFLEALNIAMEDAGDDNPHWTHLERMQASAALANARSKRNKYGPRDGGDGNG